ncbi:hypothetical protein B0H10DRAFT_2323768, partial [Mycena sp. CBHHK59/15]
MEKNPVSFGSKSFERRVRHIKSRHKRTQKILLRRWYSTPWDFGPVEKPVGLNRTAPAATSEAGPVSWTSDGKVSMQEVDDCNSEWSSETEGLRKTKVADASASSPGECCGISPLRSKEVLDSVLVPDAQIFARIGVNSEYTASAEGLRKNKVADAHISSPGGSQGSLPLKRRQVVDPQPSHSVDEHTADIFAVLEEAQLDALAPGTEQPEIIVDGDTSIFTRHTDPFNPARVARILDVVEIGDDLTAEERGVVEATIREYADVYALSISEVKAIPGAVHRLHVPEDAKFSTKIQQRRLTPPQTAYFSKAIDAMIEAGVISPIAAADVKCVSPITLAAKAH